MRVLVFACLLLIANKSAAQMPAPSPSPAPTPPPAPSLIKLNIIVTGAAKHTVAGLHAEDFRVTEDGVPQTVSYFSAEPLPLTYTLLVDNSGSVRSYLDYVIAAGKLIAAENREADETSVVRFVSSDKIEVLLDFSTNKEQLARSLDQMFVEGGETAVTDAIYLSAQRLAARESGNEQRRRAIILLSDGEDRASYYKQEELLKLLRREPIQIFPISIVEGLSNEGGTIRRSPREKAMKYISTLAEETGGRAFFPKNVKELKAAVELVVELLHQQYVLGYTPMKVVPDGKHRKVEVKLNETAGSPKRTVTARSGYTASGNATQEKPRGKDK